MVCFDLTFCFHESLEKIPLTKKLNHYHRITALTREKKQMPAFSRAEGGTASSSLNGKKKSLNLPIILKKKVNFAKIKNKEELNQWTEQKVTDMLPFEDEVLNGLIVNMFEECSETGEAVDGAKFYELLLPFLEKENTETFMTELWSLVTELDEETGIPKKFIEAREAQKRKREEKANQFRKNREDMEHRRGERRERDRDRKRQRGYNNHGGGGGGGGRWRSDSRERKRERDLPYDR